MIIKLSSSQSRNFLQLKKGVFRSWAEVAQPKEVLHILGLYRTCGGDTNTPPTSRKSAQIAQADRLLSPVLLPCVAFNE